LAAFFARTKTKQEKIAALFAPVASSGAAPAPGAAATTTAATTMAGAGQSGEVGGMDMAALERAANKDNKVYTVFDRPNGQMKFKKNGADSETVVQPRFFGRNVAPLAGEGRRDTLARAVLGSDLFAKTFVDRTWEQLFGRGIVEPWDDLGGEHDSKHPPLLTRVSDDFRASGYDIKHLLRLLVLTRAYGLTSRVPATAASAAPAASADTASTPPPPDPAVSFARAAVRRMTPEELFRSLIAATGVDRLEQLDADKVQKRIERALKEYLFMFADEDMTEVNTFNGNIPQALLLFNGELTNQGAKQRPGSNLARILAASNDPATRLRQMFLTTYTRPPTDAEQARLLPALGSGPGARTAYEDLFFALLTSTEMLTNH
jgi:hypothetical protein